eukprot:453729_1
MDESLVKMIFETNKAGEIKVNAKRIVAIFPKVKEFKNQHGYWVQLSSFEALFATGEMKHEQLKDLEIIQKASKSIFELCSKIQQIDQSLSRYYRKCDRNDYFENGVGKFNNFCDANGIFDDTIDELLTESSLMFLDIDEDFPLMA